MDSVFAVVMDTTLAADESKAGVVVDVSGFRRFSLLGRFEASTGTTCKIEINHEGQLVATEHITVGAAGWLNFSKEYIAYGPKIGVVFYHPSAPLKVKMRLYAGR